MIRSEVLLGLPEYEVTAVDEVGGMLHIAARFLGKVSLGRAVQLIERAKPKDSAEEDLVRRMGV